VITAFLARNIGRRWQMFEESSLKNTGLVLRPVSATSVAQAKRQPTADPDSEQNLERWQPDWILVSRELKKIAIIDLCRPSDASPEQLPAAAIRKQDGYSPLVEALAHYTDSGWIVHVFPWVVGTRGLIDPSHVHALLDFLELPGQCKKPAVEQTVVASVKALYFMHQVRFGGLHCRSRVELDHHNGSSDSDSTDDEELRNGRPTQANLPNIYAEDAALVNDNAVPSAQVPYPCHARQEALKRQRLNPQAALPHCAAAAPVLPEQPKPPDHDRLSTWKTATTAASGKSRAAVGCQSIRPPRGRPGNSDRRHQYSAT
jgi:hypothetical protein